MSTCMYCGAQLAPGAMGCGRCGRPVAQQQQPPQQQWQQPYQQQPQQPYPQQPQQPYPQQPYAQPPQQAWQQPPPGPAPAATEWKWGYSRWVGIHYGPIPVGIIIAIIVLAAYSSSR